MTKLRSILWILVALVLLLLACGYAYKSFTKSGAGGQTQLFRLGVPFSLTDHKGGTITEKALEGHPALVFFGFTNCPEVCPVTLFEISEWLEELGPEGEALRPFFVTVDPERDTPEVLHDYVTAYTDRITGISGDPAGINALLKGWRVYAKKGELDEDGGYNIDHTASVYLVRADGSFQGTIAWRENKQVALDKLRMLVASGT